MIFKLPIITNGYQDLSKTYLEEGNLNAEFETYNGAIKSLPLFFDNNAGYYAATIRKEYDHINTTTAGVLMVFQNMMLGSFEDFCHNSSTIVLDFPDNVNFMSRRTGKCFPTVPSDNFLSYWQFRFSTVGSLLSEISVYQIVIYLEYMSYRSLSLAATSHMGENNISFILIETAYSFENVRNIVGDLGLPLVK